MSTSNLITARASPGGPPPGLEGFAKLRWSVKNPPADPAVSFQGKTVLVTGANVGLGFEAALKYAHKGASKLILAVRCPNKGEEARKTIIEQTGRDPTSIVVMQVDLSSFESVKRFLLNLEKETHELDAVLLNAGLANPSYVKSQEGWEMALQVGVLATALMAVELLPLLRRTAAAKPDRPHLTFVNSVGHHEAKRDDFSGSLLERANDEAKYDTTKNYSLVKLLGMAVMKRVAQATTSPDGTPSIIVNACCPFMCRTNLGRSFSVAMRIPMAIFQRFTARTAEEGSRTLVGATALGPESQGGFWHHDVLFPMGDLTEDNKLMAECWADISAALLSAEPNIEHLLDG